MMYRATRRGVAAGAATALAIGTLTIFGTSVANAAPVVRDWADGKTSFNRTISNGTPGVGETITVTTKFRRTDNITETINWITDVNPPCLTYVPGSAKVNGNPVTPAVNPNRGGTPPSGTVTVSGLTLVNAPGTNNPSYSVDYKVGANCALGSTLQTGMDYSGDRGAGYYGFGGPNITAGKGNPATTLAPVAGAVKVGQSTTLAATVTGGGSATGNPVEFYDGATKIGQGNLDAAGNVTLAWTPATAGGHSLTAKFLGTATANQVVSAVQNVTVTPADVTTTTTVTGPATAVAGADVTLDVQVSPVPSGGTVQFKDGATNIGGPVTLGPDGKGSITQQFATGARSITAVYAGAGEFQASTSGAHNVTVTPANVDTTTTVSGDTTGVVGSDVALTVNVSPAPAGGTVQFKNGADDLGTPVTLDGAGNASIAAPLAAGNHAITAVYSGFNEHQGSTSGAHNVTVTPANVDTTTTVSGDTTGVVGSDVALTVNVSPAPAAGALVQFKNGADDIGAPVALDAAGNGSLSVPLAAGNHAITAVFAGAGEFQGSTSAAFNVAVSPANVATTTTVTGDATGVVGSDVALSAHVSPAPALGGKVQFKNGDDNIGGLVDLDAQGNASIAAPLAAGNHAITAVFSGFNEHQASTSAAFNVTVTPANVATTTTVTGDATGVVGTDVALSAHVSPAPALGGKVQFKNGDDNIGGLVDLDAQGNASIAAPLAAGNHAITAVFSGFNEHQGSTSGAFNVTVTPANVATTTTVSGDSAGVVGSDVALTVNVSPTPAGGTVQFKNGADDLGAPVTLDASGNGSLSVPLAAGNHAITAVYSGAGEFQGSTSGAHNVAVTPANVDTTTTVSGDSAGVVGSDVALTVNVSPTPAGGTVQFKNGADDIGAPVTLDDQGNGTIAVPMAEGSHVITAVFSGFGDHQGSTSAAHNVTVTPAAATDEATTTVLTLPVDAKAGVAVNLVATVSPTPTGGTVQFKNGGVNIGSPVGLTNGKATRSYVFPTVGDHQITAVYTGTAGFLGSDSDAGTVSVGEAPEPGSGSASGSLGSLFGSS
ncbi:beta strand repeat-containing protein [Rhodococcus kronopolitis]|uniref:Beta strand repeat-containing protein n=1 Tax=Rhodococcus kronopolitis TaxID=1460226 RepID=A0ABV9FW10_9NOCA